MKHAREIKVGLLAIVCLFLLFFGFNFLKGVNIFSPTNPYYGRFTHLHGLEEQAAVFIRGHKVGHVNSISYNYEREDAYRVDIAINEDIELPQGTQMVLIADGLLGGMAIELAYPENYYTTENESWTTVSRGDSLPTAYTPGLMELMQDKVLAELNTAVETLTRTVNNVDSLVMAVKQELADGHLHSALANIDRISDDLTDVSAGLQTIMAYKVPNMVNNADTAIANLNTVIADLKAADLHATIARADTALDGVNVAIASLQPILTHVDAAVVSADSLLVDLKAHPKRYVHFSLFGKKDKK